LLAYLAFQFLDDFFFREKLAYQPFHKSRPVLLRCKTVAVEHQGLVGGGVQCDAGGDSSITHGLTSGPGRTRWVAPRREGRVETESGSFVDGIYPKESPPAGKTAQCRAKTAPLQSFPKSFVQ